jgi:hypothetical protein
MEPIPVLIVSGLGMLLNAWLLIYIWQYRKRLQGGFGVEMKKKSPHWYRYLKISMPVLIVAFFIGVIYTAVGFSSTLITLLRHS